MALLDIGSMEQAVLGPDPSVLDSEIARVVAKGVEDTVQGAQSTIKTANPLKLVASGTPEENKVVLRDLDEMLADYLETATGWIAESVEGPLDAAYVIIEGPRKEDVAALLEELSGGKIRDDVVSSMSERRSDTLDELKGNILGMFGNGPYMKGSRLIDLLRRCGNDEMVLVIFELER